MSEFVGAFYARLFLQAPISANAPVANFDAILVMTRLKSVNPKVAIPCFARLNRQKWYLTKELMIMCLADEDLQVEIRSAIAMRLTEIPKYYADFHLGKPNFPKCSFDESDGFIGMVSLF